jgi:hypothetical protein
VSKLDSVHDLPRIALVVFAKHFNELNGSKVWKALFIHVILRDLIQWLSAIAYALNGMQSLNLTAFGNPLPFDDAHEFLARFQVCPAKPPSDGLGFVSVLIRREKERHVPHMDFILAARFRQSACRV